MNHAQKRRKVSRVISNPYAEDVPEALLQRLDINAAPLGAPSPSPNHRTSTMRKVSNTPTRRRSSGPIAVRQPSGSTPTARRVSGQKQPLGPDMSFGNGTSTVRQFRRVSAEADAQQQPYQISMPSVVGPPKARADENAPPLPPLSEIDYATQKAAATPIIAVTKESLLGRRAHTRAIDAAFQESYAQTADQTKREALARVAQAWSLLDRMDPGGEFLLLKTMVDKLGEDAKVAAALGLGATRENRGQAAATPQAQKQSVSAASRVPSEPATPTGNPQKAQSQSQSQNQGQKLVLSQNNPHLRSHRRRQSTAVVVEKEPVIEESKLPGYVVPGMEHAGMLADVLYGRWMDGLRNRWPLA